MKLVLVSAMSSNEIWNIPYGALRLKAAVLGRAESSLHFPLHIEILAEPAADLQNADDVLTRYRPVFENADVVGFSMYVWNRVAVEGLASRLREQTPRPVLIAGGPETEYRDEGPGELFDLVIPGEGEEALVEVLAKIHDGIPLPVIQASVVRSAVSHPESLPSPYLSFPEILKTHDAVLWELSRGCPYKCAFCFESKGFSGVRRFSEETALAELKLFRKSGVNQVFVLDPTFNHNDSRAKRMLRMIEAEAPDIHFTFEVRAELLNETAVELFSRITCALQIGVQSSDVRVLELIDRTLDAERFAANVAMLNEYGIVYGFDLVYGLPGDTLEGFFRSVDFTVSLLPNHVDIFPLSILPGTALYDRAPSLGLARPAKAPYVFEPREDFSGEDIKAAERFESAFDAFYNKGKAVSWFHLLIDFLELPPSVFFAKLDAPEDIPEGPRLRDYQMNCIGLFLPENEYPGEHAVMRDIVEYFSYDQTVCSGFTYDPDDLLYHLENGVTDLGELAAFVRKAK